MPESRERDTSELAIRISLSCPLIARRGYVTPELAQNYARASELCSELGMGRDVIVVTFLAILELVRRHRVAFEQPEAFDDIRLFAPPKVSA